MSRSNMEALRCSFCRKSQDVVGKLISSPADHPRAYICDECVQKFTPEDQQCLLSGLAEWERRDSDPEVGEVRRMALAMLGMDPA